MKKKTSRLLMLGLLVTQSLLPVSHAFAEDQSAADKTVSSEASTTYTSEAAVTSQSSSVEMTQSNEATVNPAVQSIEKQPTVGKSKAPTVITEELLTNFTVATIDGDEYSQTEVNRVKNATPVLASLSFYVGNPGYDVGSVYTFRLPDHLGYSAIDGKVKGVDANWAVDTDNQTLSITFNQRVAEAYFQLDLSSYIYSESNPLLTIETPGQTKNTYAFDLYEDVEPIKYEEAKNTFGLNGTIFYNLDRTLSGAQTLELSLTAGNSASFLKKDEQELSVYSYDVDVNGVILPETKQPLVKGTDYTVTKDSVTDTVVAITAMNQQKAYGLVFDRLIGLEDSSDNSYSFYAQYPTTKLGDITLKRPATEHGNLEFTAKTSQAEKMLKELSAHSVSSASYQAKGNYSLTVYSTPTVTKAGESIIIESQNGQKIAIDTSYVYTPAYQAVQLADAFDIKEEDNKLVLTAKEDNILRMLIMFKQMDFEEKDINISLSTPVIDSGKSILMISDEYIQPISIINADNAETAWGNFDRNGFYMDGTSVNVEGSTENSIKNLEILVKHPDYLTLRATKDFTYYKLNQDYTITATSEGSLVKFTTPITQSINFPLGFNYVPDGLAKTQYIPVDTIPVTIKADGYDSIDTSVKTNRKLYSEATLQSSKNQFLVNARNDSFDSLKVTTTVPAGVEAVFNIYDVSNDQVESIYPQLWDRETYFDHPISPDSAAYPEIIFDDSTNSYQFDFGKTSKRYIIEYKYANGWIDTKKVYVNGKTPEPLNNNQELTKFVTLENEAVAILAASQTSHDTLKNVTVNQVQTKHVNAQTRKIKNPVFDITTKGTTKAGIDLNSVTIDDVPKDSYRLEATTTGVKIIFDDYTLTDNISIHFNTISQNAGEISTETTIQSESLEETSADRKKVTSQPLVLKFTAGDAEGIVYLAKAGFYTYDATNGTKTVPVSEVHFTLTDKVTGLSSELITDDAGTSSLNGIMSGKYQLTVTDIPENYLIDDEYLTGKEITINKGENQFDIPLATDQTSVKAKDSTIYVGSTWQPQDNFVSATNQAGDPVDFSEITITGTVDTTKAGINEVVYHNGTSQDTAIITVKEDQTSIFVKDSTIYVGDDWKPADNFIKATDREGQALAVEALEVTGKVDNQTVGKYQITYTIKAESVSPVMAREAFAEMQQPITKTVSAVATITVLDRADNKPTPNKPGTITPSKPKPNKPAAPKTSDQDSNEPAAPEKAKAAVKTTLQHKDFPQTGEKTGRGLLFVGVVIIIIGLGGFLLVKKKTKD
jgi:LPXTG-motif cell wall-anchored protein